MSFVYFQKKKKVKKERKEESVLLCQSKGEPRPWELRGTVYFESFHCTIWLSPSPFTTWSRDFRARLANWSEARKVFCHDSNFMKSTLIIRKNQAGRKISALFVCFLFGFATNLILIFQQISASLFKGVPLRVCQPLPFHSTYQLKHSSTLSLKIS